VHLLVSEHYKSHDKLTNTTTRPVNISP